LVSLRQDAVDRLSEEGRSVVDGGDEGNEGWHEKRMPRMGESFDSRFPLTALHNRSCVASQRHYLSTPQASQAISSFHPLQSIAAIQDRQFHLVALEDKRPGVAQADVCSISAPQDSGIQTQPFLEYP
jgi:hypothetical protein